MKKEYKMVEVLDVESIYKYKLYCNDDFVNEYIDREAIEKAKENLVELDKLREEAPEFKILDILQKLIKST